MMGATVNSPTQQPGQLTASPGQQVQSGFQGATGAQAFLHILNQLGLVSSPPPPQQRK